MPRRCQVSATPGGDSSKRSVVGGVGAGGLHGRHNHRNSPRRGLLRMDENIECDPIAAMCIPLYDTK